MDRRKFAIGMAMCAATPAFAGQRILQPYRGPEVTRVVVYKDRRRLYLLHHTQILKEYKISLGDQPAGPKRFRGDGKTPEGSYIIDRRNPKSSYHLSIGISYPNEADVAYAQAYGKSAGGDIFIHGTSGKKWGSGRDWTAGCIAVKDRYMEEIYMMVRNGTQVDLFA